MTLVCCSSRERGTVLLAQSLYRMPNAPGTDISWLLVLVIPYMPKIMKYDKLNTQTYRIRDCINWTWRVICQ